MLGLKVSLSRHKKTDILSSNFSEHNAMRLEISYKKKKKNFKKKHKHMEATQCAVKAMDH